jgi:hypothetical protein
MMMGEFNMYKTNFWARRPERRWMGFLKIFVGFSAVLALMSAVLYAEVWLAQEESVETALSLESLAP